MSKPEPTAVSPGFGRGKITRSNARRTACVGFGISLLVLIGFFSTPLLRLASLASNNELYSHIWLIPLVSLYLASSQRGAWAQSEICRDRPGAFFAAGAGLTPLLTLWLAMKWGGWQPALEDSLFLVIGGFVALILAIGLFFFGRRLMGSIAVPVAMLFFLVPFPKAVESGIERFFQYASADAASFLFQSSDISFLRRGLVFDLPQISLEVGPECSGIRSSLVLLITSLVAGQLFLRTPWKRAVLTFAIVPLAILRNGFRIFVIGWLCVHVDPAMIHSWVHRKGGPLFFVVSLVPFFALLLLLRKSEVIKGPVRREQNTDGAIAG